jgi:hypothetical protein
MVRHFDLLQTGAPKYCGSVLESGEVRVPFTAPEDVQQKLAQIREFC